MKKALFSVLLAAAAVLPAQAQQRNILLIIADDLGSDSFPLTASAGASLPPMPNISALKNSGVLFRNTYAQPTCSPTRATILTGRYTFRTGIGQQVTAASGQLTAAEFTLPEAFAANPGLNYSLAMFGKWHLNAGAGSNDTPRTFGGWPHFAGTISGALPDYSNWTKVTNNVTSTVTSYATTELTNDVIAWIASRPAGTPWFAWAAYNAPHTPFHFPPAHLHSFGAAAATDRNQYEAMCEALDTEVGRLLAAVNLANTHVIFIGDNGTPGSVIQTPYTNAHSKGGLYEGGVRVPMIIAGPDVVSPNRNHDGPVHSVDLYSTILELAGINASTTQPAANPIDSTSLLPILKNTVPVSRTVFSQVFGPDYTTTAGRVIKDASGYTLLQYDDGREELYNIATSPNQTSNLLGTSITSAAQSAYAAMKLQLANYSVTGIPNEPLVHSWFTQNSGRYARIYETDASQSAQTAVTTWNRGAGVQTLPVYAGVQQVDYSANWVYVHTSGLGSHIMGPWYLNAARTNLFPNYPANTAAKFRFPRVPAIPASKTLFGGGTVGYFVDGVSVFDIRDAFYWDGAAEVNGSGYWNRDAFVNEGVTFDRAGAHQAQANHHYHANPKALRHLLGDHVDHNPASNTYTENTTNLHHSPILGWVRDGLPIYGPYAYSDPLNANSGIRRMISGFVLRNGANGTDNLTVTGRTSIPAWAQRAYTGTPIAGPPVNATYPLGRYLEDNAYLGDLGYTLGVHFDLNEYNVRWCVTPEFPGGTWAYFLCVDTAGNAVFPYQVGRSYFGSPTGGAVTAINESVSTSFIGGPFKADRDHAVSVNPSNGDVTLVWSGVEGGSYQILASENLTSWTGLTPTVSISGGDHGTATEAGGATGRPRRFYRTSRTGVGSYDRNGIAGTYFTPSGPTGSGPNTVTPNSGARGTSVNVVIELDPNLTPSLPPSNVNVFEVTVGGQNVTASNWSRPSTTIVLATFTIGATANTTARNVSVRFGSATGVLRTINAGFTVTN